MAMTADGHFGVHRIRGRNEARAYLHPVWLRIIGLLGAQSRTLSQVARLPGVHPANLSHHFRTLRATGLIGMVEARRVLRILHDDLGAAIRLLPEQARGVIGLLATVPIDEVAFTRFAGRLEELVREFRAEASEGAPAARPSSLNLSLYPYVPPAE